MEFTKNDLKMFAFASLGLILISFVFPPLGFSSPSVGTNEIPEFNVSKNTFEFIGEPQEKPKAPSEGTLVFIQDNELLEDNRQVWLDQERPDRFSITLVNDEITNATSDPQAQVNLNRFNNSGSFNEQTLLNESEFKTLSLANYTVSYTDLSITNLNESDMTMRVNYQVESQPQNDGFLSRIPVIGNLASGLAGVLGWLGGILYRTSVNIIVGTANVGIILFNIVTFFINFAFWLGGTYGSVVSNSPESWVTVILAIPGIIISFEFAKLIIIITRSLPFT